MYLLYSMYVSKFIGYIDQIKKKVKKKTIQIK